MDRKSYDTLVEAMNDYKEQGYHLDYQMTNEGMYCKDTGRIFQPDQITIRNFFRFEGMTDLDDMSILYIIESEDGEKGLLLDAYGPYSDERLGSFLKKANSEVPLKYDKTE